MLKKFIYLVIMAMTFTACEDVKVANDDAVDVNDVNVDYISDEMAKVRDYIPKFAVAAHRGSTFWVPEETEASYRWAREIGADYLEADLQVTKDGVILALHDDNLTRTTDIESVYGETVPSTRKQYYMDLGYSASDADARVRADRNSFQPNKTSFYTYSELLVLDAGTWFNHARPEQAREAFSTQRQYISSLEDMIMIAMGKRLKRDANGVRVWKMVGRTGEEISSLAGTADVVKYEFEYVDDEVHSGNIPGLYLEFKEPWLNPADFEKRVFDELDRLGMNVVTKPADSEPNYKDGNVNVGNSNGKVILQTFSLQSLVRVSENFGGKVPMCFLLWKGGGATDLKYDTALGYASYVNLAVEYKAHIIGPPIGGAPNNYTDLNKPWQYSLTKKAGLLAHPYSFDTMDQMKKYFGDYYYGIEDGVIFNPPYFDGLFTNRTEMTLQYLIDKDARESGAPTVVPDSRELLERLGY